MNKIDKLAEPKIAQEIITSFPQSVAISAKTGDGLPEMLDLIRKVLYENMVPIKVRLPYNQGQLISLFHETGQIDRIENERTNVLIQGRIPGRVLAQFNSWLDSNSATQNEVQNETDETAIK